MNGRAVARHLVMVNWRGVHFQPFALDQHVTVLEGSNGAGKTTAMAAALVVLMPSMRHLHLTNVGESTAKGGDRGLYGRLGNPARPSWSAIDVLLPDSTRCIIGVQLDQQNPPVVKISPFIIDGIPSDVPLAQILIDARQPDTWLVPDRPTLRTLVALAGGTITYTPSLTAYFNELFDRGIVPMRMSDDSDALQHWSDLLRTSMSGGLSRLITEGLKTFLLRAEDHLIRTLDEIRENLNICRRTHAQVQEAQRTHGRLEQISTKGKHLLAHATGAVYAQAREAQRQAEVANTAANLALEHRDACERDADAAASAVEQLAAACTAAESRTNDLHQRAQNTATAWHLQQKLDAAEIEHRRCAAELQAAEVLLDQARKELERVKGLEDTARDHAQRAGRALQDASSRHEEEERRANLHVAAEQRLERLRAATHTPTLSADQMPALRDRLRIQWEALSESERLLTRQVRAYERDRGAYEDLLAHLERIDATSSGPEQPVARAQRVLQRLLRIQADEGAIAERRRTVASLERIWVQRQEAVRAAAGLRPALPAVNLAAVREAIAACESEREGIRQERSDRQLRRGILADEIQRLDKTLVQTRQNLPRWQGAQDKAKNLARLISGSVLSSADVRRIGSEQQARVYHLGADRTRLQQHLTELQAQHARLSDVGSGVPAAIASARDVVGGSLLIDRFDGTSLPDAPCVQAELGPWVDAIEVEDLPGAAASIAGLASAPPEVRLVQQGTWPTADQGPERPPVEPIGATHVLVRDGPGARLVRLSETPVVGRSAREARVVDLAREMDTCRQDLERVTIQRATADAARAAADDLGAVAGELDRPDPQLDIQAMTVEIERKRREQGQLDVELSKLGLRASSVEARLKVLGQIRDLGDAVDAADAESQWIRARDALRTLDADIAWTRQHQAGLAAVESGMSLLRDPPPDPSAIDALRAQAVQLAADVRTVQRQHEDADDLARNPTPLTWTDAPATYAALRGSWSAAQQASTVAHQALTAAEAATETARRGRDDADRLVREATVNESRSQATRESFHEQLRNTGIEHPTTESVRSTQIDARRAAEALAQANREHRDAQGTLAHASSAYDQAVETAATRVADADRLRGVWEPLQETANDLRRLIEHNRLESYCSLSTDAELAALSTTLWTKAVSSASTLATLIKTERTSGPHEQLRDGLLEDLNTLPSSSINGAAAVRAWVAVGAWMQRLLPAEVATHNDLFATLYTHKQYVDRLASDYQAHEINLRHQTQEIAQKLLSARRAAVNRINDLNRYLAEAKFGNVIGVRITHEPNRAAEQALEILKGAHDTELWSGTRSFAESLAEILQDRGGNPERYLDYRTYLDLHVDVQRSSGVWDPARSQDVSTGEAIGTGFSLMMATLLHWESVYGSVVRNREAGRSMRLLFLDEVSRLDEASQASLANLCEHGGVQILLAAPSFPGGPSSTVYHLTRVRSPDGERTQVQRTVMVGRRKRTS